MKNENKSLYENNRSTPHNVKTIEKDRAFFGAYLNSAHHNLFIVLTHINDTFIGKGGVGNEGQLLQLHLFKVLSGEERVDKSILQSIYRRLNRYFPFLKWMVNQELRRALKKNERQNIIVSDEHIKTYGEILQKLTKQLWNYRNRFSHFLCPKQLQAKDLIHLLNGAFDAARNTIQERFNYSPEEVKHLVRLGAKGKEAKGFRYSFLEKTHGDTPELSKIGLIFFTTLFLQKREANLFLKKIRGFKKDNDKKFKATLDCFMVNSIRLPQNVLTSDDSVKGLLLDMLNELRKCPGILYNHLSKEDKKQFLIEPEEDSESENTILLKRYDNRFTELVMKYFDIKEVFPTFRFLVKYGRFYYRFDEKNYLGEPSIRWLTRDLYAFERISNIKKFKATLRADGMLKKTTTSPDVFLKDNTTQPYISDQLEQFVEANGNLLFSITPQPLKKEDIIRIDDSEHNRYQKPKGTLTGNQLISMSSYDLPAMLLYYLMTGDSEKARSGIEGRVLTWKKNFTRFIRDVENGKVRPFRVEKKLEQHLHDTYALQLKSIPKSIKRKLINKPVATNWDLRVQGVLDKMIAETKRITKKIDNEIQNRKKPGQRYAKLIESGKLADILARDMIFFVRRAKPMKDKRKPNSSEFRQLQKIMAFWGGYKQDLPGFIHQIGIKDYHPFLEKTGMKTRYIYQFFKSYMEEKIRFLQHLREQQSYTADDVIFLNIPLEKNIQQVCREILQSHHLQLPRGFFNELCWSKIKDEPEAEKDGNSLSQLLEKYQQSDYQPMYDLPRVYDFYDKWLDNRKKKEKFKPLAENPLQLNERTKLAKTIKDWIHSGENEKRLGIGNNPKSRTAIRKNLKSILDTEQKIRLHRTQDQVLFRLIQKDLKEEVGLQGIESVSLSNIEGFFDQTLKYELNTTDGHTIIDSKMKLKDYGKFQSILHDRRLPGLLKYYDKNHPVERLQIMEELRVYEAARPEVMETIYRFEEKMEKAFPEHFKSLWQQDEGQVVSHYHFLQKLLHEQLIDARTKKQMGEFRNSFSHNQFPDPNIIGLGDITKEKIAEQLKHKAMELYQNAMKTIALKK